MEKIKKTGNPTSDQYNSYQKIYNYFNEQFFDGKLPPCFLNFSREKKKVAAIFRSNCWFPDKDSIFHEISLNPLNLDIANQQEIAASIVHEMCHLWQMEYGSPGRTCYHNKEWAEKMESIGLQPFNVKRPEMNTGDNVSDKVKAGGKFEHVFKQMPAEFHLPLQCTEGLKKIVIGQSGSDTQINIEVPNAIKSLVESLSPENAAAKTNIKVKYSCSCPGDEQKNLWGKPGLSGIRCEDCGELFATAVDA